MTCIDLNILLAAMIINDCILAYRALYTRTDSITPNTIISVVKVYFNYSITPTTCAQKTYEHMLGECVSVSIRRARSGTSSRVFVWVCVNTLT